MEVPNDNPYWIDSACFYLSVPELRLHGFIFYFFRPNLNMLTGGPIIWDPSGHTVLDCLHYNFSQYQPLPKAAQKFDFEAANSLRVTTVDPQNRYALVYNSSVWNFSSNGKPARRFTLHPNATLRDISYGVRDYAKMYPPNGTR